jgi:hypothetical protein
VPRDPQRLGAARRSGDDLDVPAADPEGLRDGIDEGLGRPPVDGRCLDRDGEHVTVTVPAADGRSGRPRLDPDGDAQVRLCGKTGKAPTPA